MNISRSCSAFTTFTKLLKNDLVPRDDFSQDSHGLHCEKPTRTSGRVSEPVGGARRDRTADLLLAKQALSQLSYGPDAPGDREPPGTTPRDGTGEMVGLGRFELPTSPLSGVRSNQLSYRPG